MLVKNSIAIITYSKTRFITFVEFFNQHHVLYVARRNIEIIQPLSNADHHVGKTCCLRVGDTRRKMV